MYSEISESLIVTNSNFMEHKMTTTTTTTTTTTITTTTPNTVPSNRLVKTFFVDMKNKALYLDPACTVKHDNIHIQLGERYCQKIALVVSKPASAKFNKKNAIVFNHEHNQYYSVTLANVSDCKKIATFEIESTSKKFNDKRDNFTINGYVNKTKVISFDPQVMVSRTGPVS